MMNMRPADRVGIAEAAAVLEQGGLVGYATETYYGLGARLEDEAALRRLFDLKHRPVQKPFSLIIPDEDALIDIAEQVPSAARDLIRRYWPGPLTLVFHARPVLSRIVAPEGTVAVRVPGESAALDLARACGFAITATSANPSGAVPAQTAQEVAEYFPHGLDLILNGGRAPGELPSTIVDFTQGAPRILRQGACAVSSQGMS